MLLGWGNCSCANCGWTVLRAVSRAASGALAAPVRAHEAPSYGIHCVMLAHLSAVG